MSTFYLAVPARPPPGEQTYQFGLLDAPDAAASDPALLDFRRALAGFPQGDPAGGADEGVDGDVTVHFLCFRSDAEAEALEAAATSAAKRCAATAVTFKPVRGGTVVRGGPTLGAVVELLERTVGRAHMAARNVGPAYCCRTLLPPGAREATLLREYRAAAAALERARLAERGGQPVIGA